jgi:hypothetical protein
MTILFDESTPFPLRSGLTGHVVHTVQELGWSGMKDGALLARAEGKYDLFVTADQNLRHQQNLSGLNLAILVLPTPSWPKLFPHIEKIRDAINRLEKGVCQELDLS